MWTLAEHGPALLTADVAEAAYAAGFSWGVWGGSVVVLAPSRALCYVCVII